ncbi:integrin alpha-6 isoform 2-T3 [Pholidichthys leucotaenia]
MGVTVQSQGPGGKIVTCAHRYQQHSSLNTSTESRVVTGRCYVLSQNLTINPSDSDGGDWNFCEGRQRSHERFGYCQQGVSATFTKDYHYVVFGAPGAYNWKGIVRMEQKNNTLIEMGVYDDGPYEVGDEFQLNPDRVPLPANSYLGFSLDTGHHITSSPGLTVVAGAPRANHSGAVVLLKKGTNSLRELVVEHMLHGPGLASSFGYDVAVADLNNDGWQDIIVGAPQFYMKDKDIGGAVFVYINMAGRWGEITPVRLNGNRDSMFGIAVESIGDINQDSYGDIAVGAPHDDAGKVFIYHGSAKGIETSPAQILSGRKHNTKFFGYSLAGNMDVDGNSYPDLAVGSLSDAAFIYRSRPVIAIKRDVKISPQEIDLTIKTCGNSTCFTVDACFAYKANTKSYNSKLTISYSIEADGIRRKQGLTSRVMFVNKSHTEADYHFNGTLDLRGQNKGMCIKLKARLKENIRDKMRSIPIVVSAEIIGAKPHKSNKGLPHLMPILDSSQPSKSISEVIFVKEGCKRNHVCQSNLKLEYSLFYKQNNPDTYFALKSNNKVPEFHLNYEKKDLALLVTVSNMNGDSAYEAKLVASFPNTLSYSAVRPHATSMDKLVRCTPSQNESHTDCELGNPFKRDSKTSFYIILNTKGMTPNTTEIAIGLQLQTTSVQNIDPVRVKTKVIIDLPLTVIGEASPAQLTFGGVVKGESAMKTEEDIGSLINYTFTISNSWNTSVGASLHIHWPKSNKDGKWLLYLVKITSKGPEQIRCSPESEISPVNHIKESSVSRTKREIEKNQRKPARKLSSLSSEKVLSCEKENKCVVLKCPLQGLHGTEVLLRSRLWNSTFIEEYASVSTVRLVVKASLVLNTQAGNTILSNPSTTVSVTVSPERRVAQHGGVPWWVILVAVLAGILILALLVYLLWKCGFFKRATKDQYNAAYHRAEVHVQPSDKDRLTAEA